MLTATPDGTLRGIANALEEDFTGSVEIHIHQGGVGVVKVVQSIRGGKS
jgi:hypothetical protein